MSAFEQLTELMDAQVDRHLGDSITYKVANVAVQDEGGNATIPAFLILESDDGGISGITPLSRRWLVKVAKRYVPVMKMSDTIESPKLDGKYRPMANNPTSYGAYWVAEIQRVPA